MFLNLIPINPKLIISVDNLKALSHKKINFFCNYADPYKAKTS